MCDLIVADLQIALASNIEKGKVNEKIIPHSSPQLYSQWAF